MLYQISRDYKNLPEIRSLELYEIKFFYRGLIPELIKDTKPK